MKKQQYDLFLGWAQIFLLVLVLLGGILDGNENYYTILAFFLMALSLWSGIRLVK